ncbi:MAG: Fe-S-containing hydro-lyase [Clostridia bacterium]|nr:Fe-S-containing hydro-lyase [Clostridia bacterium]
MSVKTIRLPLTQREARTLRAGETVLLSGTIYTGRDAAHKRLIQLLDEGGELPIDVRDQVIYYVGPAPASPGHAVGSAGPTTSYRMDPYAPRLIELGLSGMIGKGKRNQAVIDAMKRYGAVYFGAVGGAAALISRSIKSSEIVCYEDLGSEAIHRFDIENFPVIVLIDSAGGSLYESGPAAFRAELAAKENARK